MYDPVIARFISPDRLVPDITGPDRDHLYDPQMHNRYSYVRNNPLKYIDPSGLELIGTQIRDGNNTEIYFYDTDTGDHYMITGLNEPAPVTSPKNNVKYGEDAKLPPGQYDLKPRPDSGTILKKGDPVYTTPGEKAGTVIDPSGKKRSWIGPHVGTKSKGCPLFSNTEEGKSQRKSFNTLFKYYQQFGGTKVTVEDDKSNTAVDDEND